MGRALPTDRRPVNLDRMTAHAQVLHSASPILPVRSLATSLRYYQDVLGFALDWAQPEVVASVTRDRCQLMLVQGDQGHPGTWMYAGAADVDALRVEIAGRGATVRVPPTNYPWGRELHVTDPDGNVLRFGSEVRPGEPDGAWIDQEGRAWPTGRGR